MQNHWFTRTVTLLIVGVVLTWALAESASAQSVSAVWSGNHHTYEYVPDAGITWAEASLDASARHLEDVTGHLAIIDSKALLDFIESEVIPGGAKTANVYVGGYRRLDGSWVWMEEGKNDLVFWNHGPIDGVFTAWDPIYAKPPNALAGPDVKGQPYLYLNSWHRPYMSSSWGTAIPTVLKGGNSGYLVEYSSAVIPNSNAGISTDSAQSTPPSASTSTSSTQSVPMPKSSEPDTQGVHMWPIAIFAAVFIGCVALIVRSLDSGFLAKDRPADHRSGDRSAKYTPAISHVYQVNNTPNLATSNYAPPPPAPTIHVESVPPLPGPARETIPFVATQGEILTEKAPLADKPVDTGWRTSVMAEAPVTAYDDVPPLFPQSESTGTEWYFRGNDQVQTGPIREADFKRKIASGDIGNETFVWTKAFGREWKRLSEVHGLFDDNLPPPLPVRRPEVSGFAAWCVALFPIIHATIIAALHFHGGISDPFGNALATSAVYYAGILVFIGWDMALMKSAGYTQITSKFAIGILMFTLVLAPVTPAFYLSYRTSFTGETNTKNIVAVIMLAIYVLLYVVSLILNV